MTTFARALAVHIGNAMPDTARILPRRESKTVLRASLVIGLLLLSVAVWWGV